MNFALHIRIGWVGGALVHRLLPEVAADHGASREAAKEILIAGWGFHLGVTAHSREFEGIGDRSQIGARTRKRRFDPNAADAAAEQVTAADHAEVTFEDEAMIAFGPATLRRAFCRLALVIVYVFIRMIFETCFSICLFDFRFCSIFDSLLLLK